jgi:hypothetical protein
MKLNRMERQYLVRLRLGHMQAPTWGSLLPKRIGLVLLWIMVIMAGAILSMGFGSPLMYYCLGLVTFSPIITLKLIRRALGLHKVTDLIVDWERVDELLRADENSR